jgi:hypothetical protein
MAHEFAACKAIVIVFIASALCINVILRVYEGKQYLVFLKVRVV